MQDSSSDVSMDLDDLFVTYDMNVRVAVQVVQAVLPGMIEGDGAAS